MAREILTWDEQELAKLNKRLTQSHRAYEPILLTGYYANSASNLGIEGGSAQHKLYLATCGLDRALANAMRQHQGPDRLAFYKKTVKPFDAAFTALMCQLQGKDLLIQSAAKPLDQATINRQLARIATFKRTVQALPGIKSNLLLTFLAFIQQLKAWAQGKPYAKPPMASALKQFVAAQHAILGVRYGN